MAALTSSRKASKDEMAREIDRRGVVIVQLEKAALEAATTIEARDAEIARLRESLMVVDAIMIGAALHGRKPRIDDLNTIARTVDAALKGHVS